MSSLAAPSAIKPILKMFAILLSATWVDAWCKQWKQDGQQVLPTGVPTPSKGFYDRVFSPRVTLWYMLFQRFHERATLAVVVADARAGRANHLSRKGRGKPKLSSKIRSSHTSAYNQARQRLPLELLKAALAHFEKALGKMAGWKPSQRTEPTPSQRPRQLLDGSTISILATPALSAVFASSSNQHGTGDWCLMRIVAGFCARTGAVLSAIAAPSQISEQALAWSLMVQAQASTLWIGDRNFGIWSIADQAVRHGQQVLVRMSKSRVCKLMGKLPLQKGEDRIVTWKPSRHDQSAPGSLRTACEGRLIYLRLIKGHKWIDLYLFTTLPAKDYPVELLVRWYAQRWQAELNFRALKTTMEMDELDVATPEMAQKEFYAGMIAYSLVRASMWSAGARPEEAVETLSFCQARIALRLWLEDWGLALAQTRNTSTEWVRTLLKEVARHKLPKRRKPRPTEIRRVRHRTQKFPPFRGSRADARAKYLSPNSL